MCLVAADKTSGRSVGRKRVARIVPLTINETLTYVTGLYGRYRSLAQVEKPPSVYESVISKRVTASKSQRVSLLHLKLRSIFSLAKIRQDVSSLLPRRAPHRLFTLQVLGAEFRRFKTNRFAAKTAKTRAASAVSHRCCTKLIYTSFSSPRCFYSQERERDALL